VMTNPDGSFKSAWTLGKEQLNNVIERGSL